MTTHTGGDLRIKTPDGATYIAATQRPDGTWRKPRRVREGYVPQDEQPKFESRVQKQLRQQSSSTGPKFPVGYSPVEMQQQQKSGKKSANNATVKTSETNKQPIAAIESSHAPITPKDHLLKKISQLQKKLEKTNKVDERIQSGELKSPEKTQLEMIERRPEVEKEIEELTKKLEELR